MGKAKGDMPLARRERGRVIDCLQGVDMIQGDIRLIKLQGAIGLRIVVGENRREEAEGLLKKVKLKVPCTILERGPIETL
jgi:hypothetical protein